MLVGAVYVRNQRLFSFMEWKQRLVNILQSENEVARTRSWEKIFWALLRGEGEERAVLMGPLYFWGNGGSGGVGVGRREMGANNDSQLFFLTSRPEGEERKDVGNEKRAGKQWKGREHRVWWGQVPAIKRFQLEATSDSEIFWQRNIVVSLFTLFWTLSTF